MTRVLAAVAVALICLSPAAHAAGSARLRGLVRDPDHKPLAGAKVSWVPAEELFRTGVVESVTTTGDGTFEIACDPGSWWVQAAAGGRFDESYVDLAPGLSPGTLTMKLRDGGALEGVVVAPEGVTA